LSETRVGSTDVRIEGIPPPPGDEIKPDAFTVELAEQELVFNADWGVFSAGEIDLGTRLLFEVARRVGGRPTVADVGTGYGALAIGLSKSGAVSRATATDVDAVALHLAGLNAKANGVSLKVQLDPAPTSLPPTELTVCNVPTHINSEATTSLLDGLASRRSAGLVLLVVHASLEDRYALNFERRGVPTHVETRSETHSVLRLG
jgi:16S rRNA G1207 methylase RsmC